MPESEGPMAIKGFSEKETEIGAVNLRITGILVLQLNENKHHVTLCHHLIKRWMFIKFKVLLWGQR